MSVCLEPGSDVGGERYQADRQAFLKFPHTRLGKLMGSTSVVEILQLCEEFVPGRPPEYFFDKAPVKTAFYKIGKCLFLDKVLIDLQEP